MDDKDAEKCTVETAQDLVSVWIDKGNQSERLPSPL
jgi:hypothetical protein